jgi:hypothetical protein
LATHCKPEHATEYIALLRPYLRRRGVSKHPVRSIVEHRSYIRRDIDRKILIVKV